MWKNTEYRLCNVRNPSSSVLSDLKHEAGSNQCFSYNKTRASNIFSVFSAIRYRHTGESSGELEIAWKHSPCGHRNFHSCIYNCMKTRKMLSIIFVEYIYIYIYSKDLLVYYLNAAIWLATYTCYLFVNRYRVAASTATKPSFFQNNNAFSSLFEIILKK